MPSSRLLAGIGDLLTGCYERQANGTQVKYVFAWWMGPATIAGFSLAFVIELLIRKRVWWVGFTLILIAPILLSVVPGSIYHDQVLIDEEHFEASYGFWFDPTVHSLRFADLSEIKYVATRDKHRTINYEFQCLTHNGKTIVVHAGEKLDSGSRRQTAWSHAGWALKSCLAERF